MKKHVLMLGLALMFVATTALVWGCGDKDPEGPAGPTGKTGPTLCPGCGQLKGSDVCCKADAEKCDGCGLAKGSPGCCKLPK